MTADSPSPSNTPDPSRDLQAAWESLGSDINSEAAPDVLAYVHRCKSDEQRRDLLVLDARQRWECGLPANVEHYANLLPAINPESDVAAMLIALELSHSPEADSLDGIDAVRERLGSYWGPAFDRAVVELDQEDKPDSTYQDAGADAEEFAHYKVLSNLGEGGFGVVYLAQREHPFRQRVALKVLKRGMDSERVLSRFEAERQALAQMDHSGISRIYDAGISSRGVPYFAMEYVRGEPITDYCNRQRLSNRRRLGLFRQVCEAVQHAHQRGVIHRDIKPTNVLVTVVFDRPTVKVIDFGVAKAIESKLSEETIFTEQGQIIGTPEYMSPEQAEMGALGIDTRTDVYALGVLLYELLVGVRPFDLRQRALLEMQRIIREEDPPKPSTHLSSLGESATAIAHDRATTLSSLRGELQRELEWIPLKAMRKDRTERYRSPLDLSDDIGAYLEGRPLEAGPESGWYRARKYLRRNKEVVIVTVGIAAIILAAGSVSAWQAMRAEHAINELGHIQVALVEFKGVNFIHPLLESANLVPALDTDFGPGFDVDAARSRVLEAVSEDQLRVLAEQTPFLALGTLLNAAWTAERIGDLNLARSLHVRVQSMSARLDDSASGPGIAVVRDVRIRSRISTARLRWRLDSDTEGAVQELKLIIANINKVSSASSKIRFEAMAELANALMHGGEVDQAIDIYNDVISGQSELLDPNDAALLTNRYNRALAFNRLRLFELGLAEHQSVLRMRETAFGTQSIYTINSLTEVAFTLNQMGKLKDALETYERLLPRQVRVLGEEHWRTLQVRANLGLLHQKLAKAAEDPATALEHETAAASHLRLALLGTTREVRTEGYRSSSRWGPGSADALTVSRWLIKSLAMSGQCEEARRQYAESRRLALGEDASGSPAFQLFEMECSESLGVHCSQD